MKAFFKYLSLITFSVLVTLAVVDFLYTKVFERGERSKYQYLRSFKDKKIDYIFLGSSRVENTLNPLVIDSITGKTSVNFGVQGARVKDLNLLVKLIEVYNIEYETIFIQLDYIYNFPEAKSEFLTYQLIPFVNENDLINQYFDSHNDGVTIKNIPLARYSLFDQKNGIRELFSNLIGKESRVKDYKGFSPLNVTNSETTHHLPDSIATKNKALKKMQSYIRSNKLNVVFFCSPFKTSTKNLSYISKLKKRIPKLIDFSKSIKDPKLFKDNLHLNIKGANKFSELFANTLLKD